MEQRRLACFVLFSIGAEIQIPMHGGEGGPPKEQRGTDKYILSVCDRLSELNV